MIIGVDLHGVIDDDPEWFNELLEGFMESGDTVYITVYIISGPPEEDIRNELKKCGLYQATHFSRIYSVVDHLREKGVEMWQDDRGTWWANGEDWWKAKAEICEKHGVGMMIDDKKEWAPHFKNIKTKFLLYGG